MPPRKSSVKRPRAKRSAKQETHYEILSLKPEASHEDIRAAYQSAILNSQDPDKAQTSSNATDSAVDDGEKSLRVQKAFDILSDPGSRAEYDKELRAAKRRRNARVVREVDVLDVDCGVMVVEKSGEQVVEIVFSCDCGGCFSVDSTELEKMGYTLFKDGSNVWFESPEEKDTCVDLADPDCFKTLGKVVIPCDSCSRGLRFLVVTRLKVPWIYV